METSRGRGQENLVTAPLEARRRWLRAAQNALDDPSKVPLRWLVAFPLFVPSNLAALNTITDTEQTLCSFFILTSNSTETAEHEANLRRQLQMRLGATNVVEVLSYAVEGQLRRRGPTVVSVAAGSDEEMSQLLRSDSHRAATSTSVCVG